MGGDYRHGVPIGGTTLAIDSLTRSMEGLDTEGARQKCAYILRVSPVLGCARWEDGMRAAIPGDNVTACRIRSATTIFYLKPFCPSLLPSSQIGVNVRSYTALCPAVISRTQAPLLHTPFPFPIHRYQSL